MKRVFLYARVSTEEQAMHGLSIEAQTSALQAWAKKEGHKVVDVYVDAGISARKPASKRPELQRLLSDVRDGKGDLIVFTKLDRWFRNVAQYYKVQEVLEQHHVDWKTIQEDYDTSNASGRLKINIMLSVAQDEADRTSERIKAINEMKRQKREPLTGDCPTGYKLEGKKFIKDPEKEKAVSAFFKRYLESGSISEAMICAHDNGFMLYYQLAHKMLSSPCYYGHYFSVDGMTPPYITKEEFDKIQSMRRKIVRKTTKNRVYIFSGLVFCDECGGRMGGRVNTNQESFFYNCTSHYMRRSGCTNNTNMLEKKIEQHLLDSIEKKMEELKLTTVSVAAQKIQRNRKAEIAALQSKCERAKELYIDGLLSQEKFKTKMSEYEDKIKSLTAEVESEKAPDFSILDSVFTADWKPLYIAMKQEKKRDFWRLIIKKITIYKDRRIEYDINV